MNNYKQKRPGQGRYGPRPRSADRPRKAPLPEGFSLFYVAISCPEEINAQIAKMKDFMEAQYGCKAAKKSPAHITLIPPFRAEDELEKELSGFVTTFNMGIVPFDVKLNGYSHFADRVLFVDVEAPNEPLLNLEKECMREFNEKFPGIIFGMKPEFSPHVTIATRDIPEGTMGRALEYFEANHPIQASFEAKALTLYRLEKGWWKEIIL